MARDSEYIIELLLENGLVTPDNVAAARDDAAHSGGAVDALTSLVKSKLVSEKEITELLAQQYGMEILDLATYEIPPEVESRLTPEQVEQFNVVPVMQHDDTLTVAMSDPSDVGTLDALRYLLGCDVDAVVAQQDQINRVIDKVYHPISESVNQYITEIGDENADLIKEDDGKTGGEGIEEDDAPIIRLVTMILIDAYKRKASDIHLEPMEKRYRVRYRIDGALQEVDSPPKYLQTNLTSRLKIMARLDITEKRIPQDGRIQVSCGGKDFDLRVSTIPTTHGESIVMRILDKASIQLDVPKLGFLPDDLAIVNRVINLPDGIFLVTGPTGSGKTTSLYAFLNTINTPARKIITAEDPVEYQLPGINQVQIDKTVGMTFAAALRSMLRQAPNIIMVGEIRDKETAEIAINAALTGHLVFSTLHTNDAPGAITRMTDMGVAPFLVASAVRAVMAQRLLRRICKECKEEYTPSPMEIHMLGLSEEYVKSHVFYHGKGCRRCNGSGYKGRIGVYEIFTMEDNVARLVFANKPSGEIRAVARANGMKSLRDDAMLKAEAGITTLSEVIFATVSNDD